LINNSNRNRLWISSVRLQSTCLIYEQQVQRKRNEYGGNKYGKSGIINALIADQKKDLQLTILFPNQKVEWTLQKMWYAAATIVTNQKVMITGSYGMFSKIFIVKIDSIK